MCLVAAILLLLLGTLPIANWIPGGHADPGYAARAQEWLFGSLVAVGGGLVLAILSRRIPALWPAAMVTRLIVTASAHPRTVVAVLSVGVLLLELVIAQMVFSGRPLLIDELVQVLQAQTFAKGQLTEPVSTEPELFSILHMVEHGGRWFSQFPPGGPLALTVGALAGATWITGPVFAALSIPLAALLFNRACLPQRLEDGQDPSPRAGATASEGTWLAATALFATAPFAVFMNASHMNHVPALWCVLLGATSSIIALQSRTGHAWASLAGGVGFGLAASVRPVDAAAFAIPAAGWHLWSLAHAPHDRSRWRDALLSGVGVVIPLVGVLWYNEHVTGQPMLFGYELLWGPSHGLGFHRAPWGDLHSPARGLELLNLYALRLQTYLFETPIPSLAPVILALLLARRLSATDRYLLASAGFLTGLYFAYWHDGFFLGPRFVYPLMPLLALWAARLPGLLRQRIGSRTLLWRTAIHALVVSAIVALFVAIPLRARVYANGLLTMRADVPAEAREARVRNALVLVQESWGAQTIARMWALGVPRSETEGLYRHTSTCRLSDEVARLERSTVRGLTAVQALAPLLADSARLIPAGYSVDRTNRRVPDEAISPACVERILDDRRGFTLLAPVLLVQGVDGNLFARHLHERTLPLMRRESGRPVYLLRRDGPAVDAPLVFIPLSRDSLLAAWTR